MGDFLSKWTPYFIISCVIMGVVLGSFLIYYFSGEVPYGALVAGLFVVIVFIVKQKDE